MVIEAEVRVQHRGCYTELLVGGAHAAQVTADEGSCILVVHTENAAQLARVLEAFRAVNPWPTTEIERTPTSVAMRIKNRPGGVIEAIRTSGCNILWPSIYRDGAEFYRVLASDRTQLELLYRQVKPLGEASIVRVSEVSSEALPIVIPFGEMAGDLTPRQLEILMRAVELGYYRRPRAADAEDVARDFGVARSTMEEHIRKAESRVIERFVEAMRHVPKPADAARRKVGRPRGGRSR